jgi:hypothetical protein
MGAKGRKQPSDDQRSKILLEAVASTDEKVCKKYGITLRTLQRYRRKFVTTGDAKLTQAVAENKAKLDKAWLSQVPATLRACLEYLQRAAAQSSETDPEAIHAIAGAMKMIAETDGTYRLIDVRISGQNGGSGAAAGSVPSGGKVIPIRGTG